MKKVSVLGFVVGFLLSLTAFTQTVFADAKSQTAIVGKVFELIEKDSLNPIDLTKCSYDMLGVINPGYAAENLVPDAKAKNAKAPPVHCLDKYSGYLPPDLNKDMKIQMAGKLSGIGATLGRGDNDAVVVADIADDSPALRAGVKKGDIIRLTRLVTEQKPVRAHYKDLRSIIDRLRGDAGTQVFLTIERAKSVLPEISLTRAEIRFPSVNAKTLPNGIGYVRVVQFGERTADEFVAAMSGLRQKEGPTKVVVDLRDNPGGLLNTALEMLYNFSDNPDDKLLTVRYRNRREVFTIARPFGPCGDDIGAPFKGSPCWRIVDTATNELVVPGKFKNYKMVILMNGNSASASEIFAGTLKDWGYTIVGTNSYGKGIGQTVYQLSDSSAFKLTTFEFLVGNRAVKIHNVGVIPNKVIDVPKAPVETDVQLDGAVQILVK